MLNAAKLGIDIEKIEVSGVKRQEIEENFGVESERYLDF
jgi:hypothetical protein